MVVSKFKRLGYKKHAGSSISLYPIRQVMWKRIWAKSIYSTKSQLVLWIPIQFYSKIGCGGTCTLAYRAMNNVRTRQLRLLHARSARSESRHYQRLIPPRLCASASPVCSPGPCLLCAVLLKHVRQCHQRWGDRTVCSTAESPPPRAPDRGGWRHLFTPWWGQTRRGAAGGNYSPQGGAQGAAALASCRQWRDLEIAFNFLFMLSMSEPERPFACPAHSANRTLIGDSSRCGLKPVWLTSLCTTHYGFQWVEDDDVCFYYFKKWPSTLIVWLFSNRAGFLFITNSNGWEINWCCCYYSIRNILVALLEALFAQIFFWFEISVFWW